MRWLGHALYRLGRRIYDYAEAMMQKAIKEDNLGRFLAAIPLGLVGALLAGIGKLLLALAG